MFARVLALLPKYIAISTREASFDVCSMAKTSTKIFVLEVMGRHAGWIAAAGGLAADAENDIPVRDSYFLKLNLIRKRLLKK